MYICTETAMAPHSSTPAWKIPWTEEPGGLQSMGSLRVGHDWATSLSLFTLMHWKRKWQPTPMFLPGESQGRGSLVGCHLRGRTESDNWSDLAAAAAVYTYIQHVGICVNVFKYLSCVCLQCRRHRRCEFDPWVRKIPWRRAWQPTPVFLPGKSYGHRSLAGCRSWGRRVRQDWAEAPTA